jgi:Kef-type K+ transport system membrane component KefB
VGDTAVAKNGREAGMRGKLLALLLLGGVLLIVSGTDLIVFPHSLSLSFHLGTMLLFGYIAGEFSALAGLPRITGYMLTGLVFGPHILDFFSAETVVNLDFINSLALAFIAFCAGAELRYQDLRKKMKSIISMITGVTLVVFTGVTAAVTLIMDIYPFMGEISFSVRLAVASLFGIIAVARSPSSTIAVINETRSRGDYCDIVLSVSIVTDVLIIMLFAVVVSVAGRLMIGGGHGEFGIFFVMELLGEIVAALAFGFFLGKGIIFLMKKVKIEFPVVVVTMGFIVIKFSHYSAEILHDLATISLEIEPLLVCMMAGFTVQNFSRKGDQFVARLDKVALPIYVAFFVIIGASIDVDTLRKSWLVGLAIVLVRALMFYIGGGLSGKFSGDRPEIYRNVWLGFITQAGVSLGLVAEIGRRFPDLGGRIQSVLIATIAINQIIGPVTLKQGLKKTGEIGRAKSSRG